MNPGGLYGQARPDNFPLVNDYRNNVVAEMMRTFKYVNMFNHGVSEVQDALKANANPPAEFNVNLLTAFSVIVRDDEKSYEESAHSVSLNATCEQLKASLNPEGKLLIISLSDTIVSISELKLKPLLKPLYEKKSNTLLKDKVIYPLIKLGLVAQTHPETPRHPKQKYYLTEMGKTMLAYLRSSDCRV